MGSIKASICSTLFSDTFNITVSANNAPTGLTLSSNTASENVTGVVIGTLSASDADGDAITYSLASGGDNDYFVISGNQLSLRSTSYFDYELANSFSITLIASDGKSTTSLDKKINIINVNESAPGNFMDKGTMSHDNNWNVSSVIEPIVSGFK